MLEWLIQTLANLLGISYLAAIALLLAIGVGGSAALRWYRSMRHQENYYLDLLRSGAAFGAPVPPGSEGTGLARPEPFRRSAPPRVRRPRR